MIYHNLSSAGPFVHMTFLGAVYNGRVVRFGARLNNKKCVCPPDEPAVLFQLARGADSNHAIQPCRLFHVAPPDERGDPFRTGNGTRRERVVAR